MKVKELIEKLQECDPDAIVVKSEDFEYFVIGTVSSIWLTEIEYQEEYGTEVQLEDCEEGDTGSFPAVYLGF